MRTKRNLSVLILFALLLTAIAPFAAFAEGNVAKIGDTGYASIAEAVAALRSGDTTFSSTYEISTYTLVFSSAYFATLL